MATEDDNVLNKSESSNAPAPEGPASMDVAPKKVQKVKKEKVTAQQKEAMRENIEKEKIHLKEQFAHLNINNRLLEIDQIFQKENIQLSDVLNLKAQALLKMIENNAHLNFFQALKVAKYMHNVSAGQILNEKKPLPEDVQFEQKTKKIRQLDGFMRKKYQLSLGVAIGISEKKFQDFLSGRRLCSEGVSTRITRYFFCDPKYFKRDDLQLPELDKLKVDESIVAIQRADFDVEVSKFQNKNYIYRNYQILSHKRRVMLFVSLGIIVIPLLAFTAYCGSTVMSDRISTISEYKNDEVSASMQALKQQVWNGHRTDTLADADGYQIYTEVKMGSEIIKISDISPSTSSYNIGIRMWMDFDTEQFVRSYYKKNPDSLGYTDPRLGAQGSDQSEDKYAYPTESDSTTGTTASRTAVEGSNGVPDWMEGIDSSNGLVTNDHMHSLYEAAKDNYPGNTSSNNYPDRASMFTISNGDIAPDSFSYETDADYTLTYYTSADKTTVDHIEYRHFTKFYFEAKIRKSFDNPRYPLESVQFHMYIRALNLDAKYMEYVPTSIIDLSRDRYANEYVDCSIDDSVYESGIAPFFAISGGYKIINGGASTKGINGYVAREGFYQEFPESDNCFGQYEVLLRANRQGISTFLKAFINLFSVIIWIVIAFYSQSYQGENQLGMMGTGLFAAISSILVGLSMVSDAGMFSLITMINIFTLAVILIMTYQCIAARSANVQNNRIAIAYNGIKLRVLFILLTVCIAIMFVALPLISYISPAHFLL